MLISILNSLIVFKLSGLRFLNSKFGRFFRKKSSDKSYQQSTRSQRSSSQVQIHRALFTNSYIESHKRVCLELNPTKTTCSPFTESPRYTPEDTKTTQKSLKGRSNTLTNISSRGNYVDTISNIRISKRSYSRTTLILLSVSSTYLIL